MSQRREFSKAVRLARWQQCGGFCEWCDAKLYVGKFEYHHDVEDTFGGKPDFDNCRVLCTACHSRVTRARARVIAKSNRVRAKHLGLKPKRSSFSTNRDSPFKKRMDGTVVRREQI